MKPLGRLLPSQSVAEREGKFSQLVTPLLPYYAKLESRNQFQHQIKLCFGVPQENNQVVHEIAVWHGLLGRGYDQRQTVQFARDGFVFSRLEPYENWAQFFGEVMRLWKIYSDIAKPAEAQRIGLRFLNKIILPPKELNFEKYIQPYPEPPFGLELPFMGFFHQDTFAVPEYPYALNITRTVQPPMHPAVGLALIIDIDAYATKPFEISVDILAEKVLADLRWLKNKAFFGSLTQESLQLFK